MKNNSHCECCGQKNPETNDGYTTCCNELVCWGDHKRKIGNPDNYVIACCSVMAEKKFEEAGREMPMERELF